MADPTGGQRALDGIKVFELGIAIAAPNCGRMMAHHGAEVFKLESPTNPDIVRMIGSAWLRDNDELAFVTPDSSPYVPEMNADKKSVALDLKREEAREAAKRLAAECDIFLANYAARALVEIGFDYESIAAVNPDVVYVQLPGFGTDPDGPYYPYVAWGPNQAPLVGIDDLTGHEGREPAGVATIAPPDYFSSLHALIAVMTALEHRERTGEGSHVDLSQFEAAVALLGPFAMAHALTGDYQSRIGNRSLTYAPEGVYPCAGEERWIAISVPEDAWEAFVAFGPAGWADDPAFATNESRLANQDALDAAIAAWTAGHPSSELAARLQAAGVAAHIVSTNEDILADTHVLESGWYQVREGTRFRRDMFNTYPMRLTDTPGQWHGCAPISGQHTVEVLTDVAGIPADEVQALVEGGAAFEMIEPDRQVTRPWEDWVHILLPHDAIDGRDLP